MPHRPPRALRLWRRPQPKPGRVTLGATRYGRWFAVALLVMLLGSLNYNLNLGFGLAFLLIGMSLAACLQTRRALRDIRLSVVTAPAVFAGEDAVFSLQAVAPTDRLAIALGFGLPSGLDDELPAQDLPAGSPRLFSLTMHAPRRGRLRPGPVLLQTAWPLGLFRAWTVVDLNLECLVWPAPAQDTPPFHADDRGQGHSRSGGPGIDDFRELRPYVPGDPPQRVSWKASTRGQGLFVKEFEGMTGETLLLDFARLQGDVESRLSALCAMVRKAHGMGRSYALLLPGRRLDPTSDPHRHKRQCLNALAAHRAGVYGPGAEDAA
ncbi:DUF58 domain-containing protein [Megalodesulfovibrio gigas]|uniref:Uncharacterized protein n=1 Tax=Megalodesulfovibrio gigas (strain ATCC 19364 / DSM 1382 / NCIMB 9332 / VKM B-1759) TaxID=1121448 RepID=T2G7T5_MEGG1|nr:DUF58 domain-containing protein [Megalodesulfovibrio gigas]AGW12630.1 hypothetical protein DGI_0728 [Megalodesulfovibrio gigas DSM 1382 = ATCC 19364]